MRLLYAGSIDDMSTLGKKEARINLKINPNLREEFQAAAHLRGASMSSILHQYIVKVVREEKERNVEQFNNALEFVRQVGSDEEGHEGHGPDNPQSAEASPERFDVVRNAVREKDRRKPGSKGGRNSGTKNR